MPCIFKSLQSPCSWRNVVLYHAQLICHLSLGLRPRSRIQRVRCLRGTDRASGALTSPSFLSVKRHAGRNNPRPYCIPWHGFVCCDFLCFIFVFFWCKPKYLEVTFVERRNGRVNVDDLPRSRLAQFYRFSFPASFFFDYREWIVRLVTCKYGQWAFSSQSVRVSKWYLALHSKWISDICRGMQFFCLT